MTHLLGSIYIGELFGVLAILRHTKRNTEDDLIMPLEAERKITEAASLIREAQMIIGDDNWETENLSPQT